MLQQLSCPPNATERILDLVSQIADQLATDLLLLDQTLLTGGREMVLDRLQLEQQTEAWGNIRTQRCNRAVDVERIAITAFQFDVLAGVTPVVVQAVIERRLQGCRKGAHFCQPLAEYNAATDSKQVFTCCIDITDSQAVIEQEHRRCQQIKAGEGRMGNVHPPHCSDSARATDDNLRY